MRALLALALVLVLAGALAATAQTVSDELVRALFVTFGAEEVELFAEPDPVVAAALGGEGVVLGGARVTERGRTEAAVFVRFDAPPAAVAARYRAGGVPGWALDRVSEGGRQTAVALCSDADGTRVSIGLADRPGGGSYALVAAEADGCADAPVPAPPPPVEEMSLADAITVAVPAPTISAPDGAVVLRRDEGRGLPTTLRLEGALEPGPVLDHLAAAFEAAEWALAGRHVDGRVGVATWTWTQHGATGVAMAAVRPDAAGHTRLVVTVLD